jgi:hypothetical protein
MEMPPPLPKYPPGFWQWALLGSSANLMGLALNLYLCFSHLGGVHDWLLFFNCGGASISVCACYLMAKNIVFRLVDWRDLRRDRDNVHRFMRERERRK